MRRTILVSAGAGLLLAFGWLRLEEPQEGGRVAPLLLLALVPALLPRSAWRLATSVPALLVAAAVCFDASPQDALARGRTGLRSFYDVALPFDPAARPEMHGLVLLAVFAFTLAVSLAVAERRAVTAAAALVVGAGWPATLTPGETPLALGALFLAAALLLLATVRPSAASRPARVTLAASAVVAAALVASTLPAVARDQIVGWETWDPYDRPDPSAGVQYVWDSSYTGVDFPDEATELLEIAAPRHPRYWRATTLDLYRNGRWFESLSGTLPIERAGRVELISDSDLPEAARKPSRWLEQQVRVTGLRDTHLVGASVPTAYDVEDDDESLDFSAGGIAEMDGGLRHGLRYTVWSYASSPSPRELAASPPDYDSDVGQRYLEVERDVYVPPFGNPGRHERVLELLRTEPGLRQHQPLYRIARSVAGASTPYGAVVKLETWLRTNPQFVYEEKPPRWPAGVPPLVDFIVRTKQGYCQHYAGAMALMLRFLGVPARVGAGFTSGRYDSDDGTWTVTDRNAHTWVEVWFRGFGWLPFDPTPGRGFLAGPYTSASLGFRGREALQALGQERGLGADGLRAIQDLNRRLARERALDRPVRIPADPGSADGRGDDTLVILLLGAIGGAGAIAAIKVVRRRARYLRRDPRSIAGACRLELAEFVRDQRLDIRPAATLAELGERVRASLAVNTERFVAAAEAARFGPQAKADEAAETARRELGRLKRAIRGRLSARRRVRGLVSLRSLRG